MRPCRWHRRPPRSSRPLGRVTRPSDQGGGAKSALTIAWTSCRIRTWRAGLHEGRAQKLAPNGRAGSAI